MNKIGNKLRELRGNRSMECVAKEVGISKSSIAMYETGKRVPKDDVKKKLSVYYNYPIADLFFAD